MRRHIVLAAATAGLLLFVSACGSDSSGTKRTVTAVVTVSSGAEVPGSGAPGSGDASATGSADASASPSSSPAASSAGGAAIVQVDPLKIDCASILSAADVKRVFNADIPNDRLKVNVAGVNADIGQTGRIRCLYGLSPDKKTGTITLALTQYTDAAAAQKQVAVTMENESNNSGQVSETTVRGYPASISLRDGGLLVMSYDNWTMAIAAPATLDPAALTAGLPPLAESALTRILKS